MLFTSTTQMNPRLEEAEKYFSRYVFLELQAQGFNPSDSSVLLESTFTKFCSVENLADQYVSRQDLIGAQKILNGWRDRILSFVPENTLTFQEIKKYFEELEKKILDSRVPLNIEDQIAARFPLSDLRFMYGGLDSTVTKRERAIDIKKRIKFCCELSEIIARRLDVRGTILSRTLRKFLREVKEYLKENNLAEYSERALQAYIENIALRRKELKNIRRVLRRERLAIALGQSMTAIEELERVYEVLDKREKEVDAKQALLVREILMRLKVCEYRNNLHEADLLSVLREILHCTDMDEFSFARAASFPPDLFFIFNEYVLSYGTTDQKGALLELQWYQGSLRKNCIPVVIYNWRAISAPPSLVAREEPGYLEQFSYRVAEINALHNRIKTARSREQSIEFLNRKTLADHGIYVWITEVDKNFVALSQAIETRKHRGFFNAIWYARRTKALGVFQGEIAKIHEEFLKNFYSMLATKVVDALINLTAVEQELDEAQKSELAQFKDKLKALNIASSQIDAIESAIDENYRKVACVRKSKKAFETAQSFFSQGRFEMAAMAIKDAFDFYPSNIKIVSFEKVLQREFSEQIAATNDLYLKNLQTFSVRLAQQLEDEQQADDKKVLLKVIGASESSVWKKRINWFDLKIHANSEKTDEVKRYKNAKKVCIRQIISIEGIKDNNYLGWMRELIELYQNSGEKEKAVAAIDLILLQGDAENDEYSWLVKKYKLLSELGKKREQLSVANVIIERFPFDSSFVEEKNNLQKEILEDLKITFDKLNATTASSSSLSELTVSEFIAVSEILVEMLPENKLYLTTLIGLYQEQERPEKALAAIRKFEERFKEIYDKNVLANLQEQYKKILLKRYNDLPETRRDFCIEKISIIQELFDMGESKNPIFKRALFRLQKLAGLSEAALESLENLDDATKTQYSDERVQLLQSSFENLILQKGMEEFRKAHTAELKKVVSAPRAYFELQKFRAGKELDYARERIVGLKTRPIQKIQQTASQKEEDAFLISEIREALNHAKARYQDLIKSPQQNQQALREIHDDFIKLRILSVEFEGYQKTRIFQERNILQVENAAARDFHRLVESNLSGSNQGLVTFNLYKELAEFELAYAIEKLTTFFSPGVEVVGCSKIDIPGDVQYSLSLAEKFYTKLLKLDLGDPEDINFFKAELIQIMLIKDDFAELKSEKLSNRRSELKKALGFDKDHPGILERLGKLEVVLGDTQAANNYFAQGIKSAEVRKDQEQADSLREQLENLAAMPHKNSLKLSTFPGKPTISGNTFLKRRFTVRQQPSQERLLSSDDAKSRASVEFHAK